MDFVVFFPAVLILYFVLPAKARNIFLLAASYFFYAVYSPVLTLYLVVCTLVTYGIALLIEKKRDGASAKTWAVIGVVLNLGALAFYKYFNFFSGMITGMLSASGVSTQAHRLDLVVPLGISFITFQTVSYIIDVYRNKLHAEKRILRFALYVAFFPKVVQGPIERAADILPQFDEVHSFDIKRFREGMIMVLYGMFMKMVVADKAAVIVNLIYADPAGHSGAALALATLLFTMQIYYDFAGYSYTAIGAAKVLGIEFKQNFRQPYLSTSVAEFWRRWHISLNTWLRDYLYIPLGGSRCSSSRTRFNTLVTFGLSGLWHGANWGYVIWGLLNGVYINIEKALKGWQKSRQKPSETPLSPVRLGIRRAVHGVVTFCLVSFAWIFFRAATLQTSVKVIGGIFGRFDFPSFWSYVTEQLAGGAGTLVYGLDAAYGVPVLLIGMAIIVVIDALTNKRNLAKEMAEGSRAIRWIACLGMIFAILLFGVYGYGYNASTFIYTNF